VHDVAAVAAPVAADELDERSRPRPAGERVACACAAHELEGDRCGDERTERV